MRGFANLPFPKGARSNVREMYTDTTVWGATGGLPASAIRVRRPDGTGGQAASGTHLTCIYEVGK